MTRSGRRSKRILSACALFLRSAGIVVLAAWSLGKAASDCTEFTQYLLWIPTPAVLVSSSSLLLISFVLSPKAARSGRALIAMIGLAAGYFVFVEIGIHRAFGRAPESPRVTLYHWNMSWPTAKRWGSFRESVPNDPAPDIAVITNPYPGAKLFSELAERLGPEFGTARSGRLAVVTRYTVLRSRGASLRVPPPWQFTDPDADIPDRDRIASNAAPTPGSGWFDEGHILMVELDTSEVFGRSTVIWAIDLPSDRRLARDRLTRYVARRIEQLETGEEAFPSPDILVGDLNIPRGSRSLDRLTKGLRDAHTIAGPGYRATWPRSFPLYHLDQTYLAPWLGVDSYRILDPGISEHRAQLLRITPGPS